MYPYNYYKKSDLSLVQIIFYLILPIIFFLTIIWLPFFKIKYILTPEQLTVDSGFSNTLIPIKNIVKLDKTNSLLSSPALSLDRIKITYLDTSSKQKNIIISPNDSDKFINLVTHYQLNSKK